MIIELVNINDYVGDDDYIYIGRPSIYGNPFSSKSKNIAEFQVDNKKESLMKCSEYLINNPDIIDKLIIELKETGIRKLGCFCYPKPCHGNILIDLINNRKYKSIF